MSTFLISYIIAAVIAGGVLTYATWKELKKGDEPLTLNWVLLYLFLTFCPGVNYLAAVFGAGWFIFDESPKIVVAGRRK